MTKETDKESQIKNQRGVVQRTGCLCPYRIHMLKSEPQCDGVRRQGL